MFIWEHHHWPHFRWDANALLTPLAAARHKQGQLLGRMRDLGFKPRKEAEWRATVEDVIRTFEIEGERLDCAEVRSSVARRLGLPDAAMTPPDRRVDGVVEMMLDAMHNRSRRRGSMVGRRRCSRPGTGLHIQSRLDENVYGAGIKVSDQEIERLAIERDQFHGEWNYRLMPRECQSAP